MSDNILARKYRPKNLSEMVGQPDLLRELLGQFDSGRIPNAFLFVGESGSGKTTVARIAALLMQFEDFHRELSAEDWDMFQVFDITESNAADVTGVDAMRELISQTRYLPRHPSKRKIFILNEIHKLTPAAQEALLVPTEDADQAVWIATTTEPSSLKVTFKRRFSEYKLASLAKPEMTALIARVSAAENIQVDAAKMADMLATAGITSPGRALMTLEKVAAGTALEAAIEGASGNLNSRELCRDLLKGEWKDLGKAFETYTNDDLISLRYMLLAYLKKVVISNGQRSVQAAEMIRLLTAGAPPEPPALVPWFAAQLFTAVQLGRS